MRIDVALATCLSLPDPDDDMGPLLDALRDAGLRAEAVAWDDPGADFGRARVTVIRSTWNYTERPAEFLAWAERVAPASALWNAREVVRWNVHKGYLLDLERRGVPIVPTELVARGAAARLDDVAAARGWSAGDVVVKPAVSAGSRNTMRVRAGELAGRGDAHLRALLGDGDALVQPYVASVEGHGERSMIWIDGEVTHAVRKAPRFPGDPESTAPAPVGDDERALAMRAIAAAREATGAPMLYGRVDLLRDEGGAPRVTELELIEPSLFFPTCAAGLRRYVAAVARLLGV